MEGMTEAFSSFLSIVTFVTPYAVAWSLGTRAFNFIVGALTGKNVSL